MDHPYLLFLGDAPDQLAAKTARGIVQWRPEWCAGQLRLDDCRADLEIPDMTLEEARDRGVRTVIVGVANAGGFLPEGWIEPLARALELGMDVASGLHARLGDIARLDAAAQAHGRRLFDVRHPNQALLTTGKGAPRAGKRLLTVGTDCSVGKMYAALAIEKEMHRRGMKADFRATGQTGIFIAGDGISVDAVVADFISGAAEILTPENDPDHWDVVEGQGSLFHPSFAGVSLGLLHGARPDALVMCHEPTRTHMRGLPDQPLPRIGPCIDANLALARITNPEAECVGLAVNTSSLDGGDGLDYLKALEDRHGLPCVDPVKTGVGAIVDRLG